MLPPLGWTHCLTVPRALSSLSICVLNVIIAGHFMTFSWAICSSFALSSSKSSKFPLTEADTNSWLLIICIKLNPFIIYIKVPALQSRVKDAQCSLLRILMKNLQDLSRNLIWHMGLTTSWFNILSFLFSGPFFHCDPSDLKMSTYSKIKTIKLSKA